jgi:hypothetical protein
MLVLCLPQGQEIVHISAVWVQFLQQATSAMAADQAR